MKLFFYPKLALRGIRKNRRLYLPYLFTCGGMVMMLYIIAFLETDEIIDSLPGGSILEEMLGFGVYVMAIFSAIFLFYTNSFLIRRRKKEFGLYNILGMGKGNLTCLVLWENLIVALTSLAGGLTAGILFSKFAELLLINLLRGEANFVWKINLGSVLITLKIFSVVFLLIALKSLWQIRISKPIELLRGENVGEKPPRANFFYALAGLGMLLCAYYLAVVIENPMEAITAFFIAVVLVILATYLLFISGSVAFCRLLQKNKTYYYRTNHFVSVSSMVYRMKRNGAGLASICILCTMVLVVLSSTMSLYIGQEDSLRSRYPRDINIQIQQTEGFDEEKLGEIRRCAGLVLEKNGQKAQDLQEYVLEDLNGLYFTGEGLIFINEKNAGEYSYSQVYQVFLVSLSEYNQLCGKEETLGEGEALLYLTKTKKYEGDRIFLEGAGQFRIKKVLDRFVENGIDAMQIIPTLYLILPDPGKVVETLVQNVGEAGGLWHSSIWFYGFDLDADDDIQIKIHQEIREGLSKLSQEGLGYPFQCETIAGERQSFFALYGSLFFLGVLLGLVFLFAAVLIIYYKQISEGYEDQARFEIMQNIGMTKKEIRKSINSQILTVFFLPLVTAGLHLFFAFQIISRLLRLFSLNNTLLVAIVTVGCFLAFGLFYVGVYRLTSGAYFHIVSGAREG